MRKFYPLTVKEVSRETADCVSLSFAIPTKLEDTFRFIQGQSLTLRKEINGEDIRRSYSLCTSPLENEWRVAVKKVWGGRFSTYANEVLQAGDILEVMPPTGHFYTEMNPENQKHYVAFVAGSGITPVMSIMKTVLLTEPNSRFSLFYGNRKVESIIFKEEIEDLKSKYLGRLRVVHVLSQESTEVNLFHGRIDSKKCRAFCKELIDIQDVSEVFLCGPKEMIMSLEETLASLGLDKSSIHYELFYDPEEDTEKVVIAKPPKAIPDSEVTIILDGRALVVPLDFDGEMILDAGTKNGLDLPYACKGGMCCTCKARVKEGKVKMKKNYTLEPDEVEAGYVLSCQAHPTTEKVVISFDE